MQHRPHDPYELRDIKIALAAALGRSKFSANPLDQYPQSLIGCDTEPAEVALGLRAQMLKRSRPPPSDASKVNWAPMTCWIESCGELPSEFVERISKSSDFCASISPIVSVTLAHAGRGIRAG